jgi:hypothetical protein
VKRRTIYGYYAALLQRCSVGLIAAARVDDDVTSKARSAPHHDQRLRGFATSRRRANAGCRSAEAAKAGDNFIRSPVVFGAGGTAA